MESLLKRDTFVKIRKKHCSHWEWQKMAPTLNSFTYRMMMMMLLMLMLMCMTNMRIFPMKSLS